MTRGDIVRNIINDDGYYYTKHSVLEIVNVIFDEHETAIEILMKANEEEISRHFNECEKNEAQLKAKDDEIELFKQLLEEAMKPKSCDSCEHRVFHTYDRDYSKFSSKKVKIDKCNIREQLHFNGSCDGLCCNRYKPKETK